MLLGESFSGPVAVSLAADNPAGLIGLVLVGTFVRAPRRVPPVLADLMASMPAIQPPVGLLAPFLLGRSAPPALREALGRALVAVSPPVLRARLAAVLSVDVSAEIAAVRVPVLVLRASRDRVVPKSATDLAARLCPRARKLVLPGPHLLLMAAPAESARVVAAFLDEVDNAG